MTNSIAMFILQLSFLDKRFLSVLAIREWNFVVGSYYNRYLIFLFSKDNKKMIFIKRIFLKKSIYYNMIYSSDAEFC